MTPLRVSGLVFSTVALLQGAPAPPILLGPTADRVIGADVAQITALVPPPASRPWVLVSFGPSMAPEVPWYIDVFLEPDRVTSAVRRGRVVVVKTTRAARDAYDYAREWTVDRIAEYGQVPTRRSDATRVVNGRDLNRPFRINGAISDADLAGLVRFIRTSPPDPSFNPATSTIGSHVEGTWPIGLLVSRDEGSVEVSLLDDKPFEKQGQRVTLRRDGTHWVVVRAGYWIAD